MTRLRILIRPLAVSLLTLLAALGFLLLGAYGHPTQAAPSTLAPAYAPPSAEETSLHSTVAHLLEVTTEAALTAIPVETGHGSVRSEMGDGVEISLRIETGLPDNREAYVGSSIAYTLQITNHSATPLHDIKILNKLPTDALQNINFGPPSFGPRSRCEIPDDRERIRDPFNGTVEITLTKRILCTIPTLEISATEIITSSGQLVGLNDGITFTNQATVQYGTGTQGVEVTATARVQLRHEGQNNISEVPTWFSDDFGGTLSQDWGDFDLDGDLDLILASSVGMSVYENIDGKLEPFWSNGESEPGRLGYGVRWGDFTNDGRLEFVMVGTSVDGTANTEGTTYLYRFNPDALPGEEDSFVEMGSFSTTYQLVRVETGDFNGDGYLDLVASTNVINAPEPGGTLCPLRVYYHTGNSNEPFRNDGEGFRECLGNEASASMAAADINNDDKLDLVFSSFNSQSVRYLLNIGDANGDGVTTAGEVFSPTSGLVDANIFFLPYDFAWGDYDGDGYLDLAAAFPMQREAQVYHNNGGTGFTKQHTIRTTLFRTPLAVDWGDFDGDGRLDLAVADTPPRFYTILTDTYQPISPTFHLPPTAISGQMWSLRAVDLDSDSDLDVSITRLDGPSTSFTTFAPRLDKTLIEVSNEPSGGVAWGDANGDGMLDLAFPAADDPEALRSQLFHNRDGTFDTLQAENFDGFGPHSLAFGEMTGDGLQDLAVGISLFNLRVYSKGDPNIPVWQSANGVDMRAVAWGDADDDRTLDLLVGSEGSPLALYLNQGSQLATTPAWTGPQSQAVRALAWADYNSDYYLDFAVINGDTVQLYRNKGNSTFALAWTTPVTSASSLAWGDVDSDHDPDLAVGVLAQADSDDRSVIFRNQSDGATTPFDPTPFWVAPNPRATTSLAWGDMDGDGDLDLAVGNDATLVQRRREEATQVLINHGLADGEPQLRWLWSVTPSISTNSHTTGVAWGDMDSDGDLDLAVSHLGGGGVYRNTSVTPSHLTDDFVTTMPLPDNRPYATVDRPGLSRAADFYSSAEILSGYSRPTVTISYRLFDPDGTRQGEQPNAPGDPLAALYHEYSLNGGSTWHPATRWALTYPPTTTTYRLGMADNQPFTFIWDAQADQAFSENARFRVRLVPPTTSDGMQYGSTVAVSPPFRVRGLMCVWPRAPRISYYPDPENPQRLHFTGRVIEVSDTMTYTWNFGDGSDPVHGQVTQHTFAQPLRGYEITLTVTSRPCPIVRSVTTSLLFPGSRIYLPTIGDQTQFKDKDEESEPQTPLQQITATAPTPAPVAEVRGDVEGKEGTHLAWEPPVSSAPPLGYQVYRSPMGGEMAFERIAALPALTTHYTDNATCGHIYYVTVMTERGESPASETSFASPPCTAD